MSKKELDSVKIADLALISTSEKRLLEVLVSRIDKNRKTFVTTPNPEFLVFARRNSWFKRILNKADVAVPDGIGLIWAGKILGKPIKERISGTDLMEKLCALAAKRGWKVYLLGSKPGVARKALSVLRKRHPGLKGWDEAGLVISKHLGGEAKKGAISQYPRGEDWRRWVNQINRKKPDLLFVALGMGKQEKFIYDNWSKLNVKLAMGVGGAFDYISGEVPRAPSWVRNLGLEWLYRLIREPWRWRRQLALLEFAWLVLEEKIK